MSDREIIAQLLVDIVDPRTDELDRKLDYGDLEYLGEVTTDPETARLVRDLLTRVQRPTLPDPEGPQPNYRHCFRRVELEQVSSMLEAYTSTKLMHPREYLSVEVRFHDPEAEIDGPLTDHKAGPFDMFVGASTRLISRVREAYVLATGTTAMAG